jgi:uncharacterized membrane protein YedE/YeeE
MTTSTSSSYNRTSYHEVKRRHPWRGIFFGLLFGLGLGLMAILYGWYWVGQYTPWLLVVLGVVLGILLAFVPRPWGRKPPPDVVVAPPDTTMPPPG